MHRGTAGIDAINQLMQDSNPQQKGPMNFEATPVSLSNGDKVIHLVNDAEVNVFNGDLGLHHRPDSWRKPHRVQTDEIVIDFDGNGHLPT